MISATGLPALICAACVQQAERGAPRRALGRPQSAPLPRAAKHRHRPPPPRMGPAIADMSARVVKREIINRARVPLVFLTLSGSSLYPRAAPRGVPRDIKPRREVYQVRSSGRQIRHATFNFPESPSAAAAARRSAHRSARRSAAPHASDARRRVPRQPIGHHRPGHRLLHSLLYDGELVVLPAHARRRREESQK